MRNGSKPWRLRPVGRTVGVRRRSPPGAGRTNLPSSACRMRRNLVILLQHDDRCRRVPCKARATRRPSRAALRALRPARPPQGSTCRDARHAMRPQPPAASRRAARPTGLRRRHGGRAGSACIRVRARLSESSTDRLDRDQPRRGRPPSVPAYRPEPGSASPGRRVPHRRRAASHASARSTPSVRRGPCRGRHGRPAASDS